MGYLTKLYSLFPSLGSKECCTDDEGMSIIREVFDQHIKATELALFDEFVEELYSFNAIMRRNINAAYQRGLEGTMAYNAAGDEMKEEWACFNKNRLEKFLSFWDDLSANFLKEKGHYPHDAIEDNLYYNIDDTLSPEKQVEIASKVGVTDYERAFISVKYNEKLFRKRLLSIIDSKEDIHTLNDRIEYFIQGLFADYVSRIQSQDYTYILNSGLAWYYYTKLNVDRVWSTAHVKKHHSWVLLEDIKSRIDSFLKEEHDKFVHDVEEKKQSVRSYSFDGIQEDDLKKAYKHIFDSVKGKIPEESHFDETTFLDAIYRGDIKTIYKYGVMDKLKVTIKILKDYAEKGWIESVAASVNKSVREIDGSLGYNPGGFADSFPIPPKG